MPDTPDLTRALSDRYVIERELGAGGMAVVYLAHDRKLDRQVALKVLRPELGAVLGAERFLTEIKISARLDHPHILTLIDSGDADGLLYYVLPYVRGETLRNKLTREHQLSLEDALAITKQVAAALDYAHRQGLVHRDIKPENIMLQEGEAMLTDFGIALAVREAGGARLTQTGLSLGTPQYMSPEQATGDRGIDARSDVYSLASVFYEMLAGEPPVSGPTAQAMIAKLLTERPPHLRTLRDTVPEGWDAAVSRALAKTPADRFATAGEFVRALEQGITTGISAAAAGAPRRRTAAYAAGAVVVLGLAAAGLASSGVLRGSRSRAALGQKTQLTVSGNVLAPAISPDGKQLAYLVRSCPGGRCLYSVVVQDVGGQTTRTILDGATSAYGMEWSPDRRNLMLFATVGGKGGSYLVSALGGTPRFLTGGVATFYAGGDSLLIGPPTYPDSVYWMRVAGLDGSVADSIRVPGPGQGLAAISAVPGTTWILTLVLQEPHGLWQVIGRSGRITDHVVNACTCGGVATRDAAWLDRKGDAVGESVVRIALDPATGRLSSKQDTMITGVFTNVSFTADGAHMVMDAGTLEYGVWAVNLADALAGRLPDARRVAQASNHVTADLSPDGGRLLFSRVAATGGNHTERRFSVAPFAGAPETELPVVGTAVDATWTDSVTVSILSRTPQGSHVLLRDVRTGAQRDVLDVPDSSVETPVPLSDGWAWIPASGDRIEIREGGTTRSIPRPAWYGGLVGLVAGPGGRWLGFTGYDAATNDSIGVGTVSLPDGAVTPWTTMHTDRSLLWPLADGSLLLEISETQESEALYELSGPGHSRLVGRTARPTLYIGPSADLRRATANLRNYRADAWMYDVVKY